MISSYIKPADGDSKASSNEHARMKKGNGFVEISSSFWDCDEYKGFLEKMIPLMLQPIEGGKDLELVTPAENNIPVEGEFDYKLGDDEGYGYGANLNGKYRATSTSSNAEHTYYIELGLSPESGGYMGFTIKVYDEYNIDAKYYHYFSDSDQFANSDYGKIISREEQEPLETPFGTATYFYYQVEIDDKVYEEEAALLKNNGYEIAFFLNGRWNYPEYDGECDRKIEKIVEALK